LGKGCLKRLDTFTVPLEGRKQRVVSTLRKYARRPKRLSIDVKPKLTIVAARWLNRRVASVPDSHLRESDSGLFQKLTYDGHELWTTALWPVDGLLGELRGFRKSHHLSPAASGTIKAIRGLQPAAT
jgi:hypothetical protein